MRIVRGRGLGALGMSTRDGELCVLLNFCCCIFVDVGFAEFCMGGVRGRGLGALGMSTRFGDLCLLTVFCCSFGDVDLKNMVLEVFAEGGWERFR